MASPSESKSLSEHDQKEQPEREITLDPNRRLVARILAGGGLSLFLLMLLIAVFSEEYRVIAAISAFVFFWVWKAGKTILRGNLSKL